MKLFKTSLFLKILALVTAVVTYAYIHIEISNTEKRGASDPSYDLIKLTAKKLPVKARLVATAAEGYRIREDQVSTDPSQIIVIGPEVLLENASSAETALVDVSENTRSVKRKVPLDSVAGRHVVGEPYLVEVTVPIESVEPPPAEAKKGVG